MKIFAAKKIIALILTMFSVLNITSYNVKDVADWLVGPQYSSATSAEKADMILDMYVNQDFIYMSDDSEVLVRDFISQFLIQIFSAEGDKEKISQVLSEFPVYERGERDMSRDSFTADKKENIMIKKAIRKLVEISSLPDATKNSIYYLTDGVNDVCIYFLKTKYDGVYQFAGDYIDDNGKIQSGITGVYYDSETTLIYSIKDTGIFQIGFDCKANEFMMQNPTHPWQRQYGFNVLYDILGNMLIIDTQTVRVRFDYNGKHKMIQFWKGEYANISNGAEIGLYNRQEDSIWLYDSVSDEEMLYMSMKLYNGDKLVLSHSRELHWWLTGYMPGPEIGAENLTLDCYIEFTDQAMLDAFMKSAKKAFRSKAKLSNDGLKAHIIWH